MSLADIVKALGGELYGPWRASIPGPGHGAEDRSISLFVDRAGRLVVTSFGRTAWQEVVDDLRLRGLIDADKRLVGGASAGGGWSRPAAPDLSRAEKARVAAAVWSTGLPIGGTLAERHMRSRAIARDLPTEAALRHTSRAPLRAYDPQDDRVRAALLAGVRAPDGDVCAVEVTFLDRGGGRAQGLTLSRKTIGAIPPGSAVRLDTAAGELLVGEGVFSCLSASQRFQAPAWALLSTARLVTWAPPEGVRAVLIAGDNGEAGHRAAHRLAARLRAGGVRARTLFPPPGFEDWDALDMACRRRAEREGERAGRAP